MSGDLAVQNGTTTFCYDTPLVKTGRVGEVRFGGAFAALQAFEHRPSATQFLQEGFLVSHLSGSPAVSLVVGAAGPLTRRTDMRLEDWRCPMERRALLAAHSASSAGLLAVFAAELGGFVVFHELLIGRAHV